MTDREPEPLSTEQRNALDVVRRACKDGTISYPSLYALLSNLKSDLNLKNLKNDGKLRVVIPDGIVEILDVKAHDKLTWHPTIIGDHVFMLVQKAKQEKSI